MSKYTGPWQNAAGKPDPNGLYKDGFQARFDKDVKKDNFTKKPRKDEADPNAIRSGYTR